MSINSRSLWYLAALISASFLAIFTAGLATAEREDHPSNTLIQSGKRLSSAITPTPQTTPDDPTNTLTFREPLTTTISLTSEFSPTQTTTATITPEPTITTTSIPPVFVPLIIRQPTPTPPPVIEKNLYCANLGQPKPIPDNFSPGLTDVISIGQAGYLTDIDVSLEIDHSWVGDLVVDLSHIDSNMSIRLIDRPGYPALTQGCPNDDIYTILDDQITSSVKNKCRISPAAISGIFTPEEPLSNFYGELISGQWRLTVADNSAYDTGKLKNWCMVVESSSIPIPPPSQPPPLSFPTSAQITGITGKDQALPLDCESRSAVDWAGFFGHYIGELTFFNQLPHSDNPDKGFVGNVYGDWGQIPPNPYGVHAEPVAALLRDYGLSAYAHRPLSWDRLRYEIAQGRPVYVWIIGSVENGIPVYYTPSDLQTTVVARYEHTVIVTGYTQSSVTYLNGDTLYTTSVEQFLESWSALGNMAITSSSY